MCARSIRLLTSTATAFGQFSTHALSKFLLYFTQPLQRGVSALHSIKRVLAGLMLDHVPLGLALAFAESEDGVPIELIFTNHRFGPGAVRFDVDASCPAWIFFEHRHRICPAIRAIAGVKLQNDLLLGVAGKNVPGGNALEFLEIMSM